MRGPGTQALLSLIERDWDTFVESITHAARLDLSINTVERHVVNLYRKIDARGRAEATAWAIRNGIA